MVARFTSIFLQSDDLHETRLTQKDAMLEEKFFTRSMPKHTNHTFKTCEGPKTFPFTTISKTCGGKTSSGKKEFNVLKTQFPNTRRCVVGQTPMKPNSDSGRKTREQANSPHDARTQQTQQSHGEQHTENKQ